MKVYNDVAFNTSVHKETRFKARIGSACAFSFFYRNAMIFLAVSQSVAISLETSVHDELFA